MISRPAVVIKPEGYYFGKEQKRKTQSHLLGVGITVAGRNSVTRSDQN